MLINNSATLLHRTRLPLVDRGIDTRPVPGVCSNATAPSVSSINRILRNRAAERAAAEFARAAGYGLYAAAGPHPYFNSHQHPTTSHHLPAGWPAPAAAAGHPWMLPPLATGISGAAASALLLPPSLSPGAAAAAAASAAGTSEHALHAADVIARGYLQGRRQEHAALCRLLRSWHVMRNFSYFRRTKIFYLIFRKYFVFWSLRNIFHHIFKDLNICSSRLDSKWQDAIKYRFAYNRCSRNENSCVSCLYINWFKLNILLSRYSRLR